MQSRGLPSRPHDRLAWLWLAIGASLLPFAYFQTIWPIAAWLSPVFLMRFSRTQRLVVGLPLLALAEGLGGEAIFWPPIEDIARGSDAERAQWRPRWLQVVDDVLARSRQEARAGARLITWAEESAFILKEDEPAVLAQAQAVARDEHVYLQLGLQPILRSQQFPFAENRAVLLDPAGDVVWDYREAFPIPFAETLEYGGGPALVPFTDTPYGRLAGVICFDTDYVPYMRQAGLAGVGLALEPANDWPAIENDHTHIAVYRAVENGFSMMRPDAKGVSLAVDALGRELAQGEYYSTDQLDTVATVPVQALPTLYSRIGDVIAYASILTLSALIVLACAPGLRRRRGAIRAPARIGERPAAAPMEAG